MTLWTKIKMSVSAALAALIAGLYLMLKVSQVKRNSLEKDLQLERQQSETQAKVQEKSGKVANAQQQARQENTEHREQMNEESATTRRTGKFGTSDRLR